MQKKTSTEELLKQSQEWAGWQEHLCQGCKDMIIRKMAPIQRAYNQGGLKRRWAEARMAAMTLTLWKDLCHKCLRKIKKKVGV